MMSATTPLGPGADVYLVDDATGLGGSTSGGCTSTVDVSWDNGTSNYVAIHIPDDFDIDEFDFYFQPAFDYHSFWEDKESQDAVYRLLLRTMFNVQAACWIWVRILFSKSGWIGPAAKRRKCR